MRTRRSNDRDVLGLTLRNELLNPTHQVLESEVVTTRTSIAEAERRLTEVNAKLEQNSEELKALQAEVEERQRAFNLAREEYLRLLQTSPSNFQATLAVVSDNEEETLGELSRLQEILYERRTRLENLQIEYDLAQRNYTVSPTGTSRRGSGRSSETSRPPNS